MTHTPGPWELFAIEVFSSEGKANICELSDPRAIPHIGHRPLDIGSADWDEAIANARLIAAAPELLDILESMTEFVGAALFDTIHDDTAHHYTDLARAAINKARGG